MYDRDTSAIFVDIDGVLAPWGRRESRVLDRDAVRWLRVLGVHAQLVMSSSWPLAAAESVLGFAFDDTLGMDRKTHEGRPRAMWTWLRDHPEVTSWASVDDDIIVNDAQRGLRGRRPTPTDAWVVANADHFVLTNWTYDACEACVTGAGLTRHAAIAVARALKGGDA